MYLVGWTSRRWWWLVGYYFFSSWACIMLRDGVLFI
jgi:hypothetical protein